MGKASYKIRETKNMRHFTYSGNLKDAIEKAKRDLQKEKEIGGMLGELIEEVKTKK